MAEIKIAMTAEVDTGEMSEEESIAYCKANPEDAMDWLLHPKTVELLTVNGEVIIPISEPEEDYYDWDHYDSDEN